MGAGILRSSEAIPSEVFEPESCLPPRRYLSSNERNSCHATGCSQTETRGSCPTPPRTEQLISIHPSIDRSTSTRRSYRLATSSASSKPARSDALPIPTLEPALTGFTKQG